MEKSLEKMVKSGEISYKQYKFIKWQETLPEGHPKKVTVRMPKGSEYRSLEYDFNLNHGVYVMDEPAPVPEYASWDTIVEPY